MASLGISDLIETRDWRPVYVAAAADVSEAALSRWKNHFNDTPPLRSLPAVEAAFKALGKPLTSAEFDGLVQRAVEHELGIGRAHLAERAEAPSFRLA